MRFHALRRPFLLLPALCLVTLLASAAAPTAPAARSQPPAWTPLLDELEERTFHWFWETGNPDNGLVPDHSPQEAPASVAVVGFGLTAYGIGAERGWITREQAVQRTLATLRFLERAPQNDSRSDASGYRGFFYHWIDMQTGLRYHGSEVSSIDTALLLGGVLFAQSYYRGDTPAEQEIRTLADRIYRRVDWRWMQARPPLVSMDWRPDRGFGAHDWTGYSEATMLYVLGLGSPTHPLKSAAWDAWSSTLDQHWGNFQGYTFLNFAPLFGHQYSAAWIDFRGIRDAYMRRRDLDYFENARRATYAQRAYAIANPGAWAGYGENLWGLTACVGPGDASMMVDGQERQFLGYIARGAGADYVTDDGTIAPTAAGGSIAFAPEIAIPALQKMHSRYGQHIYARYGFVDAFNPTLRTPEAAPKEGRVIPGVGWVGDAYLGIDQGPILLMLANYRSDFVWKVMRTNPYIRRGLERAGFTGGWLEGA